MGLPTRTTCFGGLKLGQTIGNLSFRALDIEVYYGFQLRLVHVFEGTHTERDFNLGT